MYQKIIQAVVDRARATLTEQRREFARGDVEDLDNLEDALKAYDLRAGELEREIRNAALEEAATLFEKNQTQRWGYTADLTEIARGIRALKVVGDDGA